MKKGVFSGIIAFVLILSLTFSAFAAEVTANFSGLQGMFSNGYFGFCIDVNLKGATTGEGFTVAESTLVATNNIDGRDISQILKIFFVECFEDLFTVEESGECKIITSKAGLSIQGVIYNYSDNQTGQIWGEERKGYVRKIEAYDGPEIPDEGHTITLDNGQTITFYFMVLEPQKEGVQSFFAVKAVAGDGATHKHNPAEKWESDEDNHWHECECGEKSDVGKHDGTTANCKNPSVCEICDKTLGNINPDNHTGETEIRNAKPATEFENGYTGDTHCADCGELLEKGETIPATHKHNPAEKWESDKDNHWHECGCGEKFDIGTHDGTTADCKNPSVCKICDKTLGNVNPDNHTGETEIRNAKPATEFENGYTGDTHCADCGELLEKGETIPATHKHNPAEKWESDDDNHWHECGCGEKSDAKSHSFINGICSTCGFESAVNDDDVTDTDADDNADKDTTGSGMNDSTTGLIPDTDSTGSVPEFNPGSGNNSDNNNSGSEAETTDKEQETEIPDTGSDSLIYAVIFVNLFAAMLTFACLKKKRVLKAISE